MLVIKVMLFYQFITVLVPTSALPFEVFLSFRGSDTREGFTDYLYKDLLRAGIRTFRDDNGIRRGENIDMEIKKAIYESKLSVIVFSKYYATSPYCLDEVLMIMERRRTVGHMVLPVFYRVRTSHVAEQTETYADAFKEHKKHPKVTTDMVEAWRAALNEVANLGGISYKDGYETHAIEKVVEEVKLKLNRTRVDIALTLVQIISFALQLKHRCVSQVFNKSEDRQKPSVGPVSFDWWFIKLMGFILVEYLILVAVCRVLKFFFRFFCRCALLFSRSISLFKQKLVVPFKVFKHFFKLIRRLLALLSGVFRGLLIRPHHNCVFLCYRDARRSKKFGKALSNNLNASKIHTSNTTVWESQKDNASIQRELDQSKVWILVLSQDYVYSNACLDLLVLIMERRSVWHNVVAIFNDVSPAEVENQNGSCTNAFNKHSESEPEDTVNKWRKALQEAATLEPKILRGDARDEKQFVKDVERIKQLTGV